MEVRWDIGLREIKKVNQVYKSPVPDENSNIFRVEIINWRTVTL